MFNSFDYVSYVYEIYELTTFLWRKDTLSCFKKIPLNFTLLIRLILSINSEEKVLFFTTLLSLLKSTGVISNLPVSSLSTLLFKLLTLFGIFFDLSISNLSTSDFKLAKSVFSEKPYLSTSVSFFKSAFVA